MMTTPVFVWLIAIPLVASPVVYLAGRLVRGPAMRWIALLALLAAWAPFVAAAQSGVDSAPLAFSLGAVKLRFDGLSLLLAAVALGLGTAVTLFSGPYMKGENGEEKYYAALVALVGIMIGLGCAGDLFNLWLWFEAMAVSSYMLVAFYRDQPASLEAGVKYLVQSATGSVLVLIGVAVVFGITGRLDLDGIRGAAQASSAGLLAAGAFLTIGFGVKAALVPLHTWLPDAHAQAPSGISAMLSGVVIEAGLVALLRALAALAGTTVSWGVILLVFGALNMLLGNLLALKQTQVKRLLAFSSLSHVGYMLLGFGVAACAGQAAGAAGGAFHLLSHGLMKGLAFLAAGALLYALYLSTGRHGTLTIADLGGASRRYPIVALMFSLAVLGLGGLPPLVGFMSKWQILVAGFQSGDGLLMALVIFAALNSVLSLGYYAPLVNVLYRHDESDAVRAGQPVPFLITLPLVIMGALVVVIGLWPALVSWLTEPAGAALLAALAR